MNIGQITRNCKLGDMLYNISKDTNIKNIVEIGTWTGMGSTKCIIDGLLERSDDYKFITVELYPEMYAIASQNLNPYLNQKIVLLNGSIIQYDDVFWFDHKSINFSGHDVESQHARLYYEKDLNFLKNSVNVLPILPPTIDLLVLDGGEYTTYPEYKLLKDRTKIIALDDTNTNKCKKIRAELIQENYKMLIDVPSERNGISIFSK